MKHQSDLLIKNHKARMVGALLTYME